MLAVESSGLIIVLWSDCLAPLCHEQPERNTATKHGWNLENATSLTEVLMHSAVFQNTTGVLIYYNVCYISYSLFTLYVYHHHQNFIIYISRTLLPLSLADLVCKKIYSHTVIQWFKPKISISISIVTDTVLLDFKSNLRWDICACDQMRETTSHVLWVVTTPHSCYLSSGSYRYKKHFTTYFSVT